MKKIAILLPAYNEEVAIASTVAEFHGALPEAQIVVIDNRSSDRTSEKATEAFARCGGKGVLLKENRPGKGNAIRKAMREIQADVYVMADADFTYKASDLPALLEPVLKGEAEVVVGNRHANATYRNQNRRPFHNFGNGLVVKLINLLFGASLQDIMSGYRVMSYRFAKTAPLLAEGFELETELSLHALDKRFAIVEMPIRYESRPEGSESKLNTFRDGFRVLKTIVWIFKDYRPLLFFGILSFLAFALGLGIGLPVVVEFMETGLVPKFPSAILASGLMISSLLFVVTGLILDTVAKIHRADFELWLNRDYSTPFSDGRQK